MKPLKKKYLHQMQHRRKGTKTMSPNQAMHAEDDVGHKQNRKAALEGALALDQMLMSSMRTKLQRNCKISKPVLEDAGETRPQLCMNNEKVVNARRLTIVSSRWNKYML
jgi:hypothetical protein